MTRARLLGLGVVVALLALGGVLWAARERRQARTGAAAPAAPPVAAQGVFPVTWTSTPWLPIPSVEACATLWRTWKAKDPVTLTFKDESQVEATTCAQWAAASDAGAYAQTTYDITMQSWFSSAATMLCALPALLPSRHSAFAGRPFAAYALELAEAGMAAASRHLVDPQAPQTLQVQVKGEEVTLRDEAEGMRSSLNIFARGDLNGDGWEDLVVDTGEHATQGTLRSYGYGVFTQVGDGRIVDITRQFTPRPLAPAVLAARRAQVAASFGLPEGVELVLRGTVEDGAGRSPVTLWVRLRDGFVEGTCTSHRTRSTVPIAGALGFDRPLDVVREQGFDGTLHARVFERGAIPTAAWDLTWTRRGQRLEARGWFLTHSPELDDVQLSCELPR